MLIDAFNHTIDIWINEIEHYSFEQLCAKPSPNSWSIGQVYMHLLEDTNYYVQQIKVCITSDDHLVEEATADGKAMLLKNDFPDLIIEGHPDNAKMPQPESKEYLLRSMRKLKEEMNKLWMIISCTPYNGKTQHPGLGYLNAKEWLQFGDMHFRHHFRQKKRIDDFLQIKN